MNKLTTLLGGLAIACAGASVAGNWVPLAAGQSTGLFHRLEQAHWISAGPKSSSRIVYIFTDPNCPYCNDLWKSMKTALPPEVQVRYLLVAVIDDDSRAKDGAILKSPDPAAALEQHERNFARGGIAPAAALDRPTAETIAANEQLMEALHIVGTPGLVYRDDHGAVKVFSGMPSAEQLGAIMGKR